MGYTEHSFGQDAKRIGKKIQVQCITCKGDTNHLIEASFTSTSTFVDSEEQYTFSAYLTHQILVCAGCNVVTFRQAYSDDSMGNDSEVQLFPKRGADTLAAPAFENVPSNLRRLYVEVIDCYNNDSATLCAAGLRALVEGVCTELGVNDGLVPLQNGNTVRKSNLEGKIFGLQERGLLTPTNAQYLHDHRSMGNEAVHLLARPSKEELRLAIEIVQHVFQSLYEIPNMASRLSVARAAPKHP
ncbi:DUF4145 domain-containing protein [Rhizobacter sp. Root1221]|uniref:DUF4145 domain-containing protein n=1 Tax=Rhizobacter sp. Root1221 TaxID=1736433 RepID=UPI0009ECC43D|nr:DUF4145 domain-containing protein [Rhizobacter sp. Root1221]